MDKSGKNIKRAFTFAELMISLIIISVVSAILYPTIAQFTPNSNKPLFKSAYKTFNEVITEIINEQPNGELGTRDANNNFVAFTAPQLCARFCEKANVIMPLKANGTPETTCNNACSNEQNGKVANTITTSNGMKWAFFAYDNACNNCDTDDKNCNSCDNKNPDPKDGSTYDLFDGPAFTQGTFRIVVDVNASNNELSQPDVDANQIFNSTCNDTSKGKCGVFMYAYNISNTGIFANSCTAPAGSPPVGIPNYNINPTTRTITTKECYNQQNLKNQDTFEIFIDRRGKIVSMSPAAWANLEDNAATGN